MEFVCTDCSKIYSENELTWKCDCGGAVNCNNSVSFTKRDIKVERMNMWRYDKAYPIKYDELTATYNEGFSPLVKYPSESYKLRIKMESQLPTGSFKDRGTVMVMNFLKNKGVEKIVEDSSGNAGAAMAAYCALGQIPCEIYIPKGNSQGKISQTKAYGAKIFEIEGTRADTEVAAQKDIRSYAGHNWHPLFVEGIKSIAYELWEQNNFMAPETIVVPGGNGSIILGIYFGFKELLSNNQIDKMPRIIVVQAKNCNPIYRAFVKDTSNNPFTKTLAEGIATAKPNRMDIILKAITETGGTVVSVSEQEIEDAVKTLAQNGFYAEPTSATAFAGITQLFEEEYFNKADDIVLIITGHGLKASITINKLFSD